MPTYAVLVEREIVTDLGQTTFIFLGQVQGHGPGSAVSRARQQFGLSSNEVIVAVPTNYWRVWDGEHEVV